MLTDVRIAALIIWRIWNYNRRSAPYVTHTSVSQHKAPRTRLENVIRIILESGMLYTLTVIATFICEIVGSNAIYPVSDVVRPLRFLNLYLEV